jgi:hypothetical protein
VRDQVSHSFKTTGEINLLIFRQETNQNILK